MVTKETAAAQATTALDLDKGNKNVTIFQPGAAGFIDVNPLHALADSIREARQRPFQTQRFSVRSFNETIREAAAQPDPVDLYRGLIHEGDLSCVFASSFLGKSVFASQILAHVAEQQPRTLCLYVDCELSDKQFQTRYTSEGPERVVHLFPDNCHRVVLNRTGLDYGANYTASIVEDLRELINRNMEEYEKLFLVFDNTTAAIPDAAKGEAAAAFMNQMKSLQREGLTMLFVAHTPKIYASRPITMSDLAGGHQMSDLFDSVFAVNRSSKGNEWRYVKQFKSRGPQGAIYQQRGVVLQFQITRGDDGAFLQFEDRGESIEAEHIPSAFQSGDAGEPDMARLAAQMQKAGKSLREIGTELGCGKDKAGKLAAAGAAQLEQGGAEDA